MSTRCELIVKETFVTKSSWHEIEDLFLINRNILKEELKKFFLNFEDGSSRLSIFNKQMMLNEKNRHELDITDCER